MCRTFGAHFRSIVPYPSPQKCFGRFEDHVREYWDYQSIQITTNGSLRIHVDENQADLISGTTEKHNSRVQETKKDVIICFNHDGITLKQGGKRSSSKSSRVESRT